MNLGNKEEKAPHEIAEVDMSVLSEVKTQQLYQWYCEIQLKLNKVQEENKKIENDIVRRHERYIMREGDYRKQIDDLQRELRVRLGFEKDADKKNRQIIGLLD